MQLIGVGCRLLSGCVRSLQGAQGKYDSEGLGMCACCACARHEVSVRGQYQILLDFSCTALLCDADFRHLAAITLLAATRSITANLHLAVSCKVVRLSARRGDRRSAVHRGQPRTLVRGLREQSSRGLRSYVRRAINRVGNVLYLIPVSSLRTKTITKIYAHDRRHSHRLRLPSSSCRRRRRAIRCRF